MKSTLLAGADIIETNTFNSNRISMSDYHMDSLVYEINKTAAQLAAEAAKKHTRLTRGNPGLLPAPLVQTNKTGINVTGCE